MAEPIRSIEELRNCIILDLELWAYKNDEGRVSIQKLTKPKIILGPRGPQISSFGKVPEYVNRYGITDAIIHHSVYTYGRKRYYLFNTPSDASEWGAKNAVSIY